jgi:dynactin complex subunit
MNRVVFNGEKGSVKYRGKLLHKVDNAKIKADEEWLGVEWDDPTKGKHNGTVEGVQYFQASAEKAGSLVLSKKAEYGQDLLEALVKRYFRDHEVNEMGETIREKCTDGFSSISSVS